MGLGRSYMISPAVIAKDAAALAPVGSGPYTLEKARGFGFDQAMLEACL